MLPSLSQLKGQFSFQLTIGMIPKRCHVSNTSFPAVIILWWPQTVFSWSLLFLRNPMVVIQIDCRLDMIPDVFTEKNNIAGEQSRYDGVML